MKQLIFALILVTSVINAVSGQVKLVQIEPSTIKSQIPVADLNLTSGKYYLKYKNLSSLTNVRPEVVAADTIGFYHVVGNDTTLIRINDCSNATGLNQTELINMFDAGAAQGATISTQNVGINTSAPEFTLDINAVDGIRVPVGTTAERPYTPKKGVIRFNTTTNKFEGYNGVKWVKLSP